MNNIIKELQRRINKYPTAILLLSWFSIVLLGAFIFYLRYPYAYEAANFYAEDGTVFMYNILKEGPIVAAFSLFNGYLIIGQYIVAEIGLLINLLFGSGFETAPKAIAVASYLFWGFVCSLPYLLFRKKMGIVLSLLTFILLTIVPMGGYDYAVIGTIGNLKFAFLFIASMLIVYRNQKDLVKTWWQFLLVDTAILLCVLTNIVSIALLPFMLWRYIATIKSWAKVKDLVKNLSFQHYSLIGILLVSSIYLIFVYLRGIPKMPGYLDEPIIIESLVNILSRGSIYGILFPVNALLNNMIVLIFIVGIIITSLLNKHRAVLVFFGLAILVNVLGFTLNRPGITHLFKTYAIDGGPGLFFYGGTMIFVFGLMFALSDWFMSQKYSSKIIISLAIIGYALLVAPAAGSGGNSYRSIINTRPTLVSEVDRVCNFSSGSSVEIGIYPAINWTMTLDRSQVCDGL